MQVFATYRVSSGLAWDRYRLDRASPLINLGLWLAELYRPADALTAGAWRNGLAFGSSRMLDNLLTRCNVTRIVTYVTQWHTCTCLRQRHWGMAPGGTCS